MRKYLILMLGLGLLLNVRSASAHANLAQSNPPANTVLEVAPTEIRLWFTEPLEAEFSQFTLRDAAGEVVDTPPSQIDVADDHQMVMQPGDVPEGVYTIVWKVVSSADGHQTSGSLAFSIGVPLTNINTASTAETIPATNSAIRWLHLLGMALGIGGVWFWMFVWQPSNPPSDDRLERRLRKVMWGGWWLLGISTFLMLLMQVTIAADVALTRALFDPALKQIVLETRFGRLWLLQMLLWFLLGDSLHLMKDYPRARWGALIMGIFLLLAHIMHSHVSAAYDQTPAILGQWLHLTSMVLWVGGLAQFINMISAGLPLPVLSRLVAHFSNFARVMVISLILTGFYAGWLLVGSVEALLNTLYGQTLIIKLLLMLPLLALAGINLIFTQRGLEHGQAIWAGRLHSLVSAEIVLLVGILVTVGVMTAISPARDSLAFQNAQPKPPAPQPIAFTQTSGDLNLNLEISPGWVGENTFNLTISDSAGNPITDASLIRLRFEHQTENLGESEIRPVHLENGVYRIDGANLSIPGDWQIRTSIQRPNQYDTVTDFTPTVPAAPLPPPPAVIDLNSPPAYRATVLLITGILALMSGGYLVGKNRLTTGGGLLASGLTLVGLVFMVTGALTLRPEKTSQATSFAPTPQTPVKIVFHYDNDTPYLLTENEEILQPTSAGQWQPIPFENPVHDIYIDALGRIWAATDAGVFTYEDEQWHATDAFPSREIFLSHGYYYFLSQGAILRGTDHWLPLDVPLSDQPAVNMVMLGDHSHVLQNGDQVFRTNDLGLGWEAIYAPAAVQEIAIDENGLLVAVTTDQILSWNGRDWQSFLPLPDQHLPDALENFMGTFYATANGQLYRQQGVQWAKIDLPGDAYFTSLAIHAGATVWVLDSAQGRLWSSTDGDTWQETTIAVTGGT